ncbi:hypothetical protein C6P44_000744 [Monosporozyma unispora]|nr:hypothetical protein C6P44_000744 [Kazachstania unispora]
MSLNNEQQDDGVSTPSKGNNGLDDHTAVDIEALEKAIGVTSLEDNETGYSDDMRSSNSRQSYRRPTPPVSPQHNNNNHNRSVMVEGSRRNSDRRSPTRQQEQHHHHNNESPRLPTLPDNVSLSSSLNSYRRNSRSSHGSSSSLSPTRREMNLPPLPDERIMSSLSNSGSPVIPRLPATPNHRTRTQSSSPIRRPLPPGY